jgi:hypothetical protein
LWERTLEVDRLRQVGGSALQDELQRVTQAHEAQARELEAQRRGGNISAEQRAVLEKQFAQSERR